MNNAIKPIIWKRKRAESRIITLPSGQEVRVRNLNTMELLRVGATPGQLAAQVFNLLDKVDDKKQFRLDLITEKEMPGLIKLMIEYFKCAVIEPEIISDRAKETEDNIHIDDVEMQDILHVFISSEQTSADKKDAQFFRGAPVSRDDAGRDSAAVSSSTVGDGGNSGTVAGAQLGRGDNAAGGTVREGNAGTTGRADGTGPAELGAGTTQGNP